MTALKSQAIWSEFREIITRNNSHPPKNQTSKYSKQPPRYPPGGWTDDRVESLKQLWADGLSASQIASKLGEVTRNSVIGKVYRLGLSSPDTKRRNPSSAPRKARKASQPLRIAPRVIHDLPATTAVLALPERRITLIARPAGCCCFIYGDPLTERHTYCAAPAATGSYCQPHYALMHKRAASNHKRGAQ